MATDNTRHKTWSFLWWHYAASLCGYLRKKNFVSASHALFGNNVHLHPTFFIGVILHQLSQPVNPPSQIFL